jgi:hypothetical protein
MKMYVLMRSRAIAVLYQQVAHTFILVEQVKSRADCRMIEFSGAEVE